MSHPFTLTTREPEINNGPFDDDELIEHTEAVAEVLAEVEKHPDTNYVREVRPEGEGHGVLVKYHFGFLEKYTRPLLDAGYVPISMDYASEGRVFVTPFEGDIDATDLYPNQSDE